MERRKPRVPKNKELAHGRPKTCLKKINDKPNLSYKYNEIIQDQLERGVIEKVESNIDADLKHYISHHAVITPQKSTTKVRIVYDASSKTSWENKS